jgi:hypothetical protein
MRNFIKLLTVIAILTGSFVIGNAQNARNLYIGYSANGGSKPISKPPKKSKKPTSKPPKKPTKPNQTGSNQPPIVVVKETATAPTESGLPGTKVTIELSRKGKLSFVKPTYKFRSGDKIRLRLMTNFEGYISLLNVGSSGTVQMLYPFQGADNKVVPSKDIQIPGSDAWIVFDDKPGTEMLTVIMSKEPLGESKDNFEEIRKSDSRDLLIEYAADGVYAVSPEEEMSKPVGFTLKLKHRK